MRNLFIVLIPAALVACSGEQPPAPENPVAAVPVRTKVADRPAVPAVQVTEASGTWSQTSGGNPRVSFASLDGESLFSVACLPANAESGAPMLEIQAVTAPDTPAERIEIYTSSSNAAVAANPAAEPGRVLGYAETGSTAHYALARGAGEIKIVAGTRATIFPTDQMLKQLIDACAPAYVHPVKAPPAPTPGADPDRSDAADQPLDDT
jgi:hypothetical protein